MLLRNILNKGNNNLDFIRIFAACMVIYGHSFAISPEPGKVDIIQQLLGFDYSGSIAVKIFFFISGLVVANSFMLKQNVSEFILSRFFRIYPALIVVCIFGYAYAFTFTTSTQDEFSTGAPLAKYIYGIVTLEFWWKFPGVFDKNNIPAFNGSLWSIYYEIGCYITMLSIFVLSQFNKKLLSAICFLIILDAVYLKLMIFHDIYGHEEMRFLPACFALGVIFSINKDKITINQTAFLSMVLLSCVLSSLNSEIAQVTVYTTIMYGVLYISSTSLLLKVKPPFDMSYGIYLYGFPIQQIIAQHFNEHGLLFNQLTSLLMAIAAGTISWFVIEKRFINIGRNILNRKQVMSIA